MNDGFLVRVQYATLTMKASCHITICFFMLVISKDFFLAASFVMHCSFTSATLYA